MRERFDPATGGVYAAVPYTFYMGKYDVTLGQYCQFLNAVARTDPYGCYNSMMAGGDIKDSIGAYPFGIAQSGSPGSYSYSVTGSNPQAANMPAYAVSWLDAARFSNWLQNGQLNVLEGTATTETGAYTLNGEITSGTESRNAGAKYFIPSENEWYKAAYYAGSGTSGATGPIPRRAEPLRAIPWCWRARSPAARTITSTTTPTRLTT